LKCCCRRGAGNCLWKHPEADEELFRCGDDISGDRAGAAATRHFQAEVALANPAADSGVLADGERDAVFGYQNGPGADGPARGLRSFEQDPKRCNSHLFLSLFLNEGK